jgi:predicted secreted protein
MSLTFGIAVYFVIWWIALFAVLPFGVRTQHEEGKVVPGTPASAPVRPRYFMIVVATTVVAAMVFALGYAAITIGLIDLRPPPPPP